MSDRVFLCTQLLTSVILFRFGGGGGKAAATLACTYAGNASTQDEGGHKPRRLPMDNKPTSRGKGKPLSAEEESRAQTIYDMGQTLEWRNANQKVKGNVPGSD